MKSLRPFIAFLSNDDGPTSVEYAVLLAMILLGIIATVQTLGSATGGMWANNNDELQAHGF